MKKLKLKALELGARELLSREQLRNVFGGSDGSDGSDDGGVGGSEPCAEDKVKACEDKNEGNSCCFWTTNGTRSDGLCRAYAPNYIKHCSDLN